MVTANIFLNNQPIEMKTKTTTEPQEHKVLLKIDTKTLENQRTFLRVLAHYLNQLLIEWNNLDINPAFDLSDIDAIERYTPDDWIKRKVIPALTEASLGGVKASPEKVYDMMEKPDFTLFKVAYGNVLEFIRETRQKLVIHMEKGVEYNSAFFFLQDDEIKVNEKRLSAWYERHCTTYAASPNQAKVFDLISKLAETMNSLKATDNPPPNSPYRTTNYTLKMHPGMFLRNYMDQLMTVDEQGTFLPNPDWAIRH
jgi:hypothetical protein